MRAAESLERTKQDSAAQEELEPQGFLGCQGPSVTSGEVAGFLVGSLVELVTLERVLGRAGSLALPCTHPSVHCHVKSYVVKVSATHPMLYTTILTNKQIIISTLYNMRRQKNPD